MIDRKKLTDLGFLVCSSCEIERPGSEVNHTLRIGSETLSIKTESQAEREKRLLDEKKPYTEDIHDYYDVVDSQGNLYHSRKLSCLQTGCVIEPGINGDGTDDKYHYTLEWNFEDVEGKTRRIYPGYMLRKTEFPTADISGSTQLH